MSIFEDLRNGDVEIAPPTAKRDLVLKAADRLRAACNDDAMFLHIMSGNIVLFNGTKGGALLTKASTLRHPTSGKFVASKGSDVLPWRHGGAVLPALATEAARRNAHREPADDGRRSISPYDNEPGGPGPLHPASTPPGS